MDKKSFIHHATKILVDVMFYGGILTCIALPFIMPVLVGWFEYEPVSINFYSAILTVAGICAVYVLFQLKTMLKTLVGGEPFVKKNVSCLRKCGVASFLMSAIFFIRIIIMFTIGSVIIVIIFALLGLFVLTLKDVFKQAVLYKEENDWTV